jgi:hypothetical protein
MAMELQVLKVSHKVVNYAVKVHKMRITGQKVVICVRNIHNVVMKDVLNAQIARRAIIVKNLDA